MSEEGRTLKNWDDRVLTLLKQGEIQEAKSLVEECFEHVRELSSKGHLGASAVKKVSEELEVSKYTLENADQREVAELVEERLETLRRGKKDLRDVEQMRKKLEGEQDGHDSLVTLSQEYGLGRGEAEESIAFLQKLEQRIQQRIKEVRSIEDR